MTVLNLTQHVATPDQSRDGYTVIEPLDKAAVQRLLTFDRLPSEEEIIERASSLAEIAWMHNVRAAMIGGAPYLMSALERALVAHGIEPLYAFTRRVVEETVQPDGSVVKTAVFRFEGWVRPPDFQEV